MKRKVIRINKRSVGQGQACFIIAEAGSNHNGKLSIAKRLIKTAAVAGADAIKFQLFTGQALSSEENIQKILRKFEFRRHWLPTLQCYAQAHNILFLATPFDNEAVTLLTKTKVAAYKIASGDLTNLPLVERIARQKKPIILSVGVANLTEIKEALQVIYATGNKQVALLHCIADYPTRVEDTNLRVIPTLGNKFHLPVGFSDHTMDIVIPAIAVILGASIVEKHFTLSRNMKGPDHSFALEPAEFAVMVKNIRKAEQALGSPIKRVLSSEKGVLITGRRGLYAKQHIAKGTQLSCESIAVLRPRRGIDPKNLKLIIGHKAKRDIFPFQPINWRDVDAK